MLGTERVLGVAAAGGLHVVEGGHAVAFLELGHLVADGLDDAGDVVALVGIRAAGRVPFGEFPVFGVGAADDDFGENLHWSRSRDGDVVDSYEWTAGDEGFFHCFGHSEAWVYDLNGRDEGLERRRGY